MKTIISILSFLLISSFWAYSQKVVVSEYSSTTNINEWSELLVIEDMTTLVGYKIRDNSANGRWQDPVIFKDIPLWRNLREGTIIVIWHKDVVSNLDIDKSDGYIEVGAGMVEYFDNPAFLGSGMLELNAEHDMIEILDPLDNHVHLLAHMLPSREADVFAGMPNPKVGTPNQTAKSVRVFPGDALSRYSGGLNSALALTDQNASMGLPNSNSSSTATNHFFWRELREPAWGTSLSINASISPDFKSVKLEWNPASTISDPNEGYIIVRYITNNNQPLELVDGHIYFPGEKVGIYTIVDTIPDLTNKTYTDTFRFGQFDCGNKYAYRVYIYRFQKSHFNANLLDADPLNARGRAYNNVTYLTTSQLIEKRIPPIPVISAKPNKTEFCQTETVEIVSNVDDKKLYEYFWIEGSNNLNINESKILATKSATYQLKIKDRESGCESISNSIEIKFIEASESIVINTDDKYTFNKDTILQICWNKTLNLQGIALPSSSKNTVKWIKDGNDYSNNQAISINQGGIYKFVVVTNGICSDTSVTLDVRFIQPNYILNPSVVSFDFDNSPFQDVTLTNLSDKDLILTNNDLVFNPSGSFIITDPVISQYNPLVIPPNSSINIRIQFQPNNYGIFKAQFIVKSECNYSKIVELTGERKNNGRSILTFEPKPIVEFGSKLEKCLDGPKIDLVLNVNGPRDLSVIMLPLLTNSFIINSNNLSFNIETNLSSNTNEIINVSPNPALTIGNYYDTLKFAYKNPEDTNYDTLKVPFHAEIINPRIQPDTIIIDLSKEPKCITHFEYNFIVNINPEYEFTINKGFTENSQISLKNPLPYKFVPNTTHRIFIDLDFNSTDDFLVHLELDPCGRKLPIKVKPPKSDLEILYKDTIDFGIINNWTNCDAVSKKFELNTSHKIKITNYIYKNRMFVLDFNKDSTFTVGTNSFDVIFPFYNKGKYLDSIKFIVEPCNKIVTIYIKGERVENDIFTINPIGIDFGTKNIGITQNIKSSFYNNQSTESIIIDKINVPAPFVLLNPKQSDFPIEIRPHNSIELEFYYDRANAGIFTDSFTVSVLKPCSRDLNYSIKGKALDINSYVINYNIKDDNNLNVNQVSRIPVSVYSSNDFTNSGIQGFTMYFRFDREIIDIHSLYPSNDALITKNNSKSIGLYNHTFTINDLNILKDGVLFEIEVLPLLGYSLETKIHLDSVIYNSTSSIETPKDSANITISGDCLIQYRTLEVNGNSGIIIKNNIINNNQLNAELNIISDEITNLNLFNLQGQNVKKIINQNLKSGKYDISINLNELPNGMYFVKYENGTKIQTIKIIINK